MGDTTITVDEEVKENVAEFKREDESWTDFVRRVIELLSDEEHSSAEEEGIPRVRLTDEEHERVQRSIYDAIREFQ